MRDPPTGAARHTQCKPEFERTLSNQVQEWHDEKSPHNSAVVCVNIDIERRVCDFRCQRSRENINKAQQKFEGGSVRKSVFVISMHVDDEREGWYPHLEDQS